MFWIYLETTNITQTGGGGVSKDVAKANSGEYWQLLAPARVRDENSSSGEVVGELKKGDFVNCVKQDGKNM